MAGPFTNRSWRYCWNLIKQLYFFLPPHLKKKDKKKIHSVFLGINFSKSGLSHFCFSRKETNDKNLDLNTLQELYCKFFFRWYSYKNRFVTNVCWSCTREVKVFISCLNTSTKTQNGWIQLVWKRKEKKK